MEELLLVNNVMLVHHNRISQVNRMHAYKIAEWKQTHIKIHINLLITLVHNVLLQSPIV